MANVLRQCLVEGLVRTVTAVADGDRPAVPLVDQIGCVNIAILTWRAFEHCISNR